MDIAPLLTLPAALGLHEAIGFANEQARLRYPRDRWVHQVRHLDDIKILIPEDPALYGAITAFRVKGRTTKDDNEAIAQYLMDRHPRLHRPQGGTAAGYCRPGRPARRSTS
ncbi:hypothetical protein LCL61_35760 [Amycolatopsis coloradensis]|uniref:Uncharacterized protein n=1 Tax=Amycolatopsis coloradensis TaxID=76021 RepID=A0ACD5BNP2_9PSEU